MNNLAVTGVPRGGTTLACRILGEASQTVALFEPMPVEQLAIEPATACDQIEAYFAKVRAKALRDRLVPSKHQAGRVPDNPYGNAAPGGVRPELTTLGEIAVTKPLASDFRLVIKHNAAFLALAPQLRRRMPMLGIMRNPLAVLASWHSVDLPVSHGRLPAGERFDPALAAALAAQPNVLRRQVIILDWCFERLLQSLSPTQLLRYEDIVNTGGRALLQAAGLPTASESTLTSRNANRQYDPALTATLHEALCTHGGASTSVYRSAELDALAERMTIRSHD